MDEGVIIVLDYEKICRLCLQTKGVLSDIFVKDDDVPLAVQIKHITSVEISDTDNLPKKICHKCRYIVEICFDLRTTVQKSNKLLCESTNMDMDRITQALERHESQANGQKVDYDCPSPPQEPDFSEELQQLIGERNFKRKQEDDEEMDEKNFSNLVTAVKNEGGQAFIQYAELGEYEIKVEYAENKSDEEFMADEAIAEGDEDTSRDWVPGVDAEGTGSETKEQNKSSLKHLTCQLCLKIAEDRCSLVDHVNSHYQHSVLTPFFMVSKPFECNMCDQKFNFKKDLIIHHRVHLNINPYTCKVSGCDYDVRSKEALRHHMYSHAEKKFVCELCGAAFRRKFELGQHSVRHMDEGAQYRCSLCHVVCKNRLSFKAHLRHHETGKRFKCTRPGCPKAFFSNTDLVIHERAHSNNKCYRCPLCVCAYISQSQLNRHLRQHQKRRVNKCDKCSESFADYAEFCNHRITTHGEWQPYKCRGCNQGYQSERQLERHMTRCRLAQALQELNVNEDGTENIQHNENIPPSDDCNQELKSDDADVKAEDTVVIEAADLQHLTNSGENYLYIEAQDDGEQVADAEGNTFMIIHEDGTSTEQFDCKVLL